jgi:hypothetical protein
VYDSNLFLSLTMGGDNDGDDDDDHNNINNAGMVGVANSEGVDHGIDSPLAGLGYGLPISRSYCRYFGGDLSVSKICLLHIIV